MFYKTGIDITNDKQMFKFLKEHFEYPTLNSWNNCYSIANKVKIHTLGLSGNCWNALDFLNSGEYDTLNWMIQEWEREHPTYEVYFNGRSGGYLVLKDKDYNGHVLPDMIVDNDDYEEYKECCRDNYGSVKANRDELVYYTKLVQAFDKLCDELRDYCDELSKLSYEKVEMEKVVDRFNDEYYDDLELLGFQQLRCDDEGKVDISEISTIRSLSEAFFRLANRRNLGYELKSDENGCVGYAA
jgi:hypothetical protein